MIAFSTTSNTISDSKDENISNHGCIGIWILPMYQIYQVNIGVYFDTKHFYLKILIILFMILYLSCIQLVYKINYKIIKINLFIIILF